MNPEARQPSSPSPAPFYANVETTSVGKLTAPEPGSSDPRQNEALVALCNDYPNHFRERRDRQISLRVNEEEGGWGRFHRGNNYAATCSCNRSFVYNGLFPSAALGNNREVVPGHLDGPSLKLIGDQFLIRVLISLVS